MSFLRGLREMIKNFVIAESQKAVDEAEEFLLGLFDSNPRNIRQGCS